MSKANSSSISLLRGLGVVGDAHSGRTVQHLSRIRQDPTQPNLRQVHLIHGELLDELNDRGFAVSAGLLGENITTRGVELLTLPCETVLTFSSGAVVALTGLRNPCRQLDELRAGLMKAVLDRAPDGALIRKAGVMGIVITDGGVRPGDGIDVELPPLPHRSLEPV